MQLIDTIMNAANGQAISALAGAHGLPRPLVADIVRAALPAIAFEIERNTLSRGGLADLVAALGHGHHDRYLADREFLTGPGADRDGREILAHILGSGEAIDGFARRIARGSEADGVDEGMVARLLPAIAGLAMGGIARATRPAFERVFSEMPNIGPREWTGREGGRRWPEDDQRPRWQDEPEQRWDDRDRGAWDDEEGPGRNRAGGGAGRAPTPPPTSGPLPEQRPLPVPGEGGGWREETGRPRQRSPFDDLSDVIRRRGGTPGAGTSGSIVRDILGQVLGFKRGGVISWIIRLIIVRFGWQILKGLLGRVLLGRR